MAEHPWMELQVLIKEKWLTQKAFSFILWKKISEVNELLKGKRNITIQWDYLLHQTLWTPIKYWILKQVDYDYSLLDTEELENKTNSIDTITKNKETAFVWEKNNFKEEKNIETNNYPIEEKNHQNEQNIDEDNWQDIEDEDTKKRAKIFRSF